MGIDTKRVGIPELASLVRGLVTGLSSAVGQGCGVDRAHLQAAPSSHSPSEVGYPLWLALPLWASQECEEKGACIMNTYFGARGGVRDHLVQFLHVTKKVRDRCTFVTSGMVVRLGLKPRSPCCLVLSV